MIRGRSEDYDNEGYDEFEDYDEYSDDYDDVDYRDERPPARGGDLDRYRPATDSPRRFWSRLLAALLAIALTAWALLFTAGQLTSAEVAVPAHERAIESLIGVREVLAIHEEEINRLASMLPAQQSVPLPGLPVTGITVTAEELEGGSVDEWHELIVGRAAELTYTEGASAFTEDEEIASGGFLSATNALLRLMETVSADRHDQFVGWTRLAGFVALALAAGVLVVGEGVRRLVPVGGALIAAGVLVAVASVLAIGIVFAAGNESSAVASELTSIAGTYARAPLQNAIWMVVAGVVIVIPAYVGSQLFDTRERDDADREIQRAW